MVVVLCEEEDIAHQVVNIAVYWIPTFNEFQPFSQAQSRDVISHKNLTIPRHMRVRGGPGPSPPTKKVSCCPSTLCT
ncbi:hypothetical protein PAXRUDRAFT_824896 [Paxillus rubicundulus Ve08.2h10]|uniref:Uncharacterized protein n=1 Tax=Paxillus rubicundulus Ve08.2h10 TaxID=930991 RepID=A0A0D0DH77_9AGAM|nr:hypothetical protein PAXRUDRAFT_824896 [Paxillus rubicundulus Ve08.2h10]